jgi:hypothetical protein
MNTRHTTFAVAFAISLLTLASCGGGGDDDDDPVPDTTDPTVSVQAPARAVNRTVTLAAEADDNVGVAEVEFFVDGESVGSDTSAPFTAEWDTRELEEAGEFVVTAEASDAAGNSTTSDEVTFTVQNQHDVEVELDVGQEVPAHASPGTASALLHVNLADGTLSGEMTVAGFTATAAHIHDAFAGQNGGVVVGLEQDTGDPARWVVPDGTVLTEANLDRLVAGAFYLNAHSATHADGHVRGQVALPGITVAIAHMAGLQEVPVVSSNASGQAGVTVNEDTGAVQIHLIVDGLSDATDAHLHSGVAGTSGGVIVGLEQDGSDPSHWLVDGEVLTAAQVDEILAAGTYVNIHTPANPDGELRGQAVPPSMLVFVSAVGGEQEFPAQDTDAAGAVAVTVNKATRDTLVHVNVAGADDATAAHIHAGEAGVNGAVALGLEQDAEAPGHWVSADGAVLTEQQLEALQAGGMYANVHTPAAPDGLVRGQVLGRSMEVAFTDLSGAQSVPAVVTTGAARAAITVDPENLAVTVHVTTENLATADAAHVHVGAEGVNGPVVFALSQDTDDATHWFATAETVTEDQLTDYRDNLWYVNVHTPANPDGEVRGQFIPNPPDAEDPEVTLDAVAATLSGTVTLSADASDNEGVVRVRFRVNGTVVATDTTAPYSVSWDTTTVADGAVTIVAQAEDAAGNIGVSATEAATVDNGTTVDPYTFTEFQAEILTPTCAVSGCHTGGSPPAGLNLSAASAYANLVNVASSEVPSLDRVTPGNADDSYIIRKLEGAAGIVGARMPFGGPYLDQETIDRIRAWIDGGAPND